MYAHTLRSIQTMKAADNTSMLKMTKINPNGGRISGGGSQLVISVRPHGRPRGTPLGRHRAAALASVGFDLGAEVLHRRQGRGRRCVAEGAECFADDVVPDADQQIDVAHLAFA